MTIPIDLSLDVRLDASGRDPDTHSTTLRLYHQQIWSRQLPNGDYFRLEVASKPQYLIYRTQKEVFYLTSDSISHSYANRKGFLGSILQEIPPQSIEDFRSVNARFSAYIIFPGNRIQGKQTINAARGCKKAIDDRFDLTLECIRRFYLLQSSPLSEVLERYKSYFRLFVNFEGYVNFFFLNDLVSDDYRKVHQLLDQGEPFSQPALPQNVEQYFEYRDKSIEFLSKRTARISNYLSQSRFVWTDDNGITLLRGHNES